MGLSAVSSCILPVPIPGRFEASPEPTDRTIDAVTAQPIAGASVMIEERPETSVLSDATGRFRLPRVRKWYLIAFVTPCPVYHFPATGPYSSSVEISHPGHETVLIHCSFEVERELSEEGEDLYRAGDVDLVPTESDPQEKSQQPNR